MWRLIFPYITVGLQACCSFLAAGITLHDLDLVGFDNLRSSTSWYVSLFMLLIEIHDYSTLLGITRLESWFVAHLGLLFANMLSCIRPFEVCLVFMDMKPSTCLQQVKISVILQLSAALGSWSNAYSICWLLAWIHDQIGPLHCSRVLPHVSRHSKAHFVWFLQVLSQLTKHKTLKVMAIVNGGAVRFQ